MHLYNTASRRLETSTWARDVHIYVCGITPYDAAHMGHIFTFVTYDILSRYLEYQGHRVKLVRNITDVDEPIYTRAQELGIPYMQLARDETAHFQEVLQQLDFLPAFAEPRASDYIEAMAAAVKRLLDNGHAYRLANGDIYFDVSTFPRFGKQSGFTRRLQTAFMASRGGDPERLDKRHPFDFLLWRAVPDTDDPARWESVVGTGRPGWHIECSVMSSDLLGTPIDIHGGGMDLIFPHHEAETAQSESLSAYPFVRHWMHVAPLYCYGEKMSKSLGNLVFAGDLLAHHDPAVIRLALLQYHYRIGGEWHGDVLTKAKEQLGLFKRALATRSGPSPALYLEHFFSAMDDDLDTPEALHVLHHLAWDTVKKGGSDSQAPAKLAELLGLLGIQLA
ncbi:MAG TPA: cysteine--tRNA ligase [Candidatus Saccharimonadales bacterium]|nr:cysteine--tRNA ligase [Candidatus Saccharimonadales bacterium]